jgi:hypothetical protein
MPFGQMLYAAFVCSAWFWLGIICVLNGNSMGAIGWMLACICHATSCTYQHQLMSKHG